MERASSQKQRIFYGYWVVVGCFFILFLFAGAGFYSFSLFIKPLENAFGWSRSQVAFGMTIYMVVSGMTAPFIGFLVERYGPRRVMAIFAIGFGTSFILVSLIQSLWQFYLAYAFVALSCGGLSFLPVSAVLAQWFIKRRGTAIGVAMLGISAGGFVMSPLIEFFNTTYSWRGAFIFLGILIWVVGLPVALLVIRARPSDMGLLPDNEQPQKTSGENPSSNGGSSAGDLESGWPLKPAMRTRNFWLVVATFMLAPAAQMGILQHQIPMITTVGISGTAAAAALGFTAALGGAGKLSFGRISESIPVHYTALLCYGLQALGVFILYNATSMAYIWAFVFIFGFSMGGNIVLLPIVVGHYFGLVAFGTIMGAVTLFQAMGAGAGAFVSGLVYDAFGSYDLALLLHMGLFLLAAVTIMLAGRPVEYDPAD